MRFWRMLDQENLYQLIFQEQWTVILNLLYSHKKDIENEVLLQHSAKIFEQVFFKKVKDYALQRKDIQHNLDTLYTLNYGKFYQLTPDNYKALMIELVKRKPLKEAVNYARHFPDEEVCKTTIINFNKQKITEEAYKMTVPKNISLELIGIYNRLF